MLARRHLRRPLDDEVLEAAPVVAVLELAVLGVQAPAADVGALGDDDALGAPLRAPRCSAVTECDLFLTLRTQFSDRCPMPPNRSWVLPLISTGRPAVSGLIFSNIRSSMRQHLVARRLDDPQPLQFAQLLRHLLGEVLGLAPVLGGVVEFPHVIVERGIAARDPGRVVLGHRGPALVVDGAVAHDLEVLRLVAFRRLGVVERVEHADAVDRVLLDAVHRDRLGNARRLEDGRRHVDDVRRTACGSRPWP